MRHAVIFLQNAAHPDVGSRLEIGAADLFADEVLRLADAGLGVDEDKAVAEAPVQKHRDRGQRLAAVARHVIAADIDLADVELGLARHAPVPLARAHAGEHDELDTVGLHGAVAQRTHDLVVAAGDGQFSASPYKIPPYRQRLNLISARRTISLSAMAIVASMATRPNSLVGSKFSVNMVVKWPMPAVET